MPKLQGIAGVITPATIHVEVSGNDGLRIPYTFHGIFFPLLRPTGPIRITMKYDDDSQIELGKRYQFEASSSNGKLSMILDSGVKIRSHKDADPVPDLPKVVGWGRWTRGAPMLQASAIPTFLNVNIAAPAYAASTTRAFPPFFSPRRR